EMMMTGSALMRASAEPRMRSSSAKPSSFGMSRSDTTMAMAGSASIACQADSPSAHSRTAKEALRMRLKVVRTNFESSTMRTRFSGMSPACATPASSRRLGGEVHDHAAAHLGVDEAVEHGGKLLEGDRLAHVLQHRRAQVAREPAPDLPAQLDREGV